jgi:hypothetical protein
MLTLMLSLLIGQSQDPKPPAVETITFSVG